MVHAGAPAVAETPALRIQALVEMEEELAALSRTFSAKERKLLPYAFCDLQRLSLRTKYSIAEVDVKSEFIFHLSRGRSLLVCGLYVDYRCYPT
jgi:hypothetical protein